MFSQIGATTKMSTENQIDRILTALGTVIFFNSCKRKRPDKLPSPKVFKNYNPGASLIVAVSIQTNFSNAPFAPVKISCETSSPSSPATSIPLA